MSGLPLRAVVDASVAVKLFVPEPLHEQARAVFASLAPPTSAELFVPDLFYVECANVVWKWVQRNGYPERDARGHLRDLGRLDLRVVPARTLAESALDLALRLKITAYDACYVAAAASLDAPLVTADERLVEKCRRGPAEMRWLGDVDL